MGWDVFSRWTQFSGSRWGFGLGVFLLGVWGAGPAFAQEVDNDPLPPLPPLDPPHEEPNDWNAWLGVPKLLGVSQAQIHNTYSFTTDITRQRRGGQDVTTVFMELARPDPPEIVTGASIRWLVTSAHGVGGKTFWYSTYAAGAGYWLGGEGSGQGSYTGPMSLRQEPSLSFRRTDGVGGFSTLEEAATAWGVNFSGTVTELDTASGGLKTREIVEVQMQDPWRSPLEHSWVDFKAPKSAVPFSARLHIDGITDQGFGSFTRTAMIQFWPDWNDIELLVEVEDSTRPRHPYFDWRPEGNLESPDQGGPRPLRVKATLRPKAESPTSEQLAAMPEVRRFRFELSDTSREPGVCMNWPSPPGTNAPPSMDDPDFDLRFIATIPDAMQLSPRKQKAGVGPLPSEDPNLPSAWVLMECFDFGAHANLQVYADLSDGRVIVGHLKVGEEKRYLVPIPDRPLGSFVAKTWRDDNKVDGADAEDADHQPTGDGQKGDGFSVYEEYRGFRTNGVHVSTDPWVKSLFVRDINGDPVGAGCRMVEENTADGGRKGLKIYNELTAEEWHPSRVMNSNRSERSPRTAREPQHGILVQPNRNSGGEQGYSFSDRIAFPRRPKNVRSLEISPNDNTAETVAHELTHSIGCPHHGDTDYYARWFVKELKAVDGTTRRWFFEQPLDDDALTGELTEVGQPARIRVFQEGSREETLPDQSTNAALPSPRRVYVAKRGGQNSGQESCYMRYYNATAYIPLGQKDVRIEASQTVVAGDDAAAYYALCKSCRGTGVNPKRYGHATRGNCQAAICVRDDAPDRPVIPGQCPDTPPPSNPPAMPSLAGFASSRALSTVPSSASGLLVIDLAGPVKEARAFRGWPLHVYWHALRPGPVEDFLTLTRADGVALTVPETSPGHWWISPEQTRALASGLASVRVGEVTRTVRIDDVPAGGLTSEQESNRRRTWIRYQLAVGQASEARREAEAWVAAEPNAVEPYALLGDALSALGLISEALDAYDDCFDRLFWGERPPRGLLQRYNRIHNAWVAQLPSFPPEFISEPEPVTLEEQERVYGQDVRGQWAATVIASSEYRTAGDYSASRATGAPDVTRYGDSPRAWASRLADSGPEWIELTFSNAVHASVVRVRQVFNPGAIDRVEVFDATGVGTTVFSGVDTNRYPANQVGWFVVPFPRTTQLVQRVRIGLDSARVRGWNEIDAVQLVAAPPALTTAPKLSVTANRVTGTLEISDWPAGFVLQRATRLAPADWQTQAERPPVSIPTMGAPAFFRLVEVRPQ